MRRRGAKASKGCLSVDMPQPLWVLAAFLGGITLRRPLLQLRNPFQEFSKCNWALNGLIPLTKASSCRTNLNRAGYGPRGNGCGDLRGRIDAKARRCEPAECDLAGARFVPLRAGLGFSVGLETKESWEGKRVRLSLPAAEAR